MTPAIVIRPIWLTSFSVNHMLPSEPAAIPPGLLPAVGDRKLRDRLCRKWPRQTKTRKSDRDPDLILHSAASFRVDFLTDGRSEPLV
jgi:hypothetical protein